MVATQIFFIFTPNFGEMIQFDSYFSNGLVQPPTRFPFGAFSLGHWLLTKQQQDLLMAGLGGGSTCMGNMWGFLTSRIRIDKLANSSWLSIEDLFGTKKLLLLNFRLNESSQKFGHLLHQFQDFFDHLSIGRRYRIAVLAMISQANRIFLGECRTHWNDLKYVAGNDPAKY